MPVPRPFVITSFHCIFVIYESFFFLHVFVEVLSTKQIGLTSMAGVYVVLGVGLVVAYLVLIAEIIWKRKQEMKVEGQLGNDKNSNFLLFTGVIPVVSNCNLIRNGPSVVTVPPPFPPPPSPRQDYLRLLLALT